MAEARGKCQLKRATAEFRPSAPPHAMPASPYSACSTAHFR